VAQPLTLPDLQTCLDRLGPGQKFALSLPEVERLFGEDDVGAGRVQNFADGHRCSVQWLEFGVNFCKAGEPYHSTPPV
jgi:hypothetical protein